MLGGLSDRIRYGWRALSFGCVIHELYFENMRDKNGGWPIIKCSGEVSTCASGERPSKTERVRIQDGETHIFIPYLTHAGGAEVARWGHEWSGGSGQISYLTRDEKKSGSRATTIPSKQNARIGHGGETLESESQGIMRMSG